MCSTRRGMISIQSHKQQVSMLNQRILALEMQLQAVKQKAAKLQQTVVEKSQYLQMMSDENSRILKQNQSLTTLYKRQRQLVKSYQFTQKDFIELRKQSRKRNELITRQLAEILEQVQSDPDILKEIQTFQDRWPESNSSAEEWWSYLEKNYEKANQLDNQFKQIKTRKSKVSSEKEKMEENFHLKSESINLFKQLTESNLNHREQDPSFK